MNAADIERIFEQRARTLAARKGELTRPERETTVLVFTLNEERYAIAIENVAKVLEVDSLIGVPNTDGAVIGILPTQEEVHTILSLGMLLGLPGATNALPRRRGQALVLRHEGAALGFLIDHVEEIDALINLEGSKQNLNRVVYAKTKRSGAVVLFVDVKAILGNSEIG